MLADDRCSWRIWYCVPLTSTKAYSWATASPANRHRTMATKRWNTEYLPRPRVAVGATVSGGPPVRQFPPARADMNDGAPSPRSCGGWAPSSVVGRGEDLDVGRHVLALGLGAHQDEDNHQHHEDHGADHHRHGEAHLHVD